MYNKYKAIKMYLFRVNRAIASLIKPKTGSFPKKRMKVLLKKIPLLILSCIFSKTSQYIYRSYPPNISAKPTNKPIQRQNVKKKGFDTFV